VFFSHEGSLKQKTPTRNRERVYAEKPLEKKGVLITFLYFGFEAIL